MKDETMVVLGRLICGAAIFITSIVTGFDGPTQGLALILMGVPFEKGLKKEEGSEESSQES